MGLTCRMLRFFGHVDELFSQLPEHLFQNRCLPEAACGTKVPGRKDSVIECMPFDATKELAFDIDCEKKSCESNEECSAGNKCGKLDLSVL